MSTSKEVVVQDACVLFDLIDLDLIRLFFELKIKVITTREVIKEVEDGEQLSVVNEFISKGKLLVEAGSQVEKVYKILFENSGLSFADSSVLELAIRIKASVLSSDMKLRNATARNGLTVRGVLWVVVELHSGGQLSTSAAVEKLRLYQNINERAPRAEIKAIIDRLLGGQKIS